MDLKAAISERLSIMDVRDPRVIGGLWCIIIHIFQQFSSYINIYKSLIIHKNGVFHESNWWLAIYSGIERRMYKKWHHFKEHPGEVFATWGASADVADVDFVWTTGCESGLLKGLLNFTRLVILLFLIVKSLLNPHKSCFPGLNHHFPLY